MSKRPCLVLKALEKRLKRFRWRCVCGKHPYPYRTRRLRHRRLMILGWRRPGKVGGCRNQKIILDSSAVEHPAVNRRVVGSNPTWGVLWSVGQGVKTPPFHGGNAGSNPARIIVWRHGQVVRQRSATPLSPVQIRVAPPKF